ncbi:acyltransferase family protein [Bacteroides fragilis]
MPIRYYNLDFLKVLAAIFITNSHFIPLYKDISPSLATFGVHGNALFFFVSGFVLMMGFEKKQDLFVNWYKKRIQRLWPSVFFMEYYCRHYLERSHHVEKLTNSQ